MATAHDEVENGSTSPSEATERSEDCFYTESTTPLEDADIAFSKHGLNDEFRDIFSENVIAKILRVAFDSLENNVPPPRIPRLLSPCSLLNATHT